VTTTEDHSYRDYEITVIHKPPAWNVGIHRKLSYLPKPAADMIVDASKERAIAEAKRRIDALLGT
jgi:hypothetical protein